MGIAGLPDGRNPLRHKYFIRIRQCAYSRIRKRCRIFGIPLSDNVLRTFRADGDLGIAGAVAGYPSPPEERLQGEMA